MNQYPRFAEAKSVRGFVLPLIVDVTSKRYELGAVSVCLLYSSNNRYLGNYSVTLLRALYGVLCIVHSTGTALASRASVLLRSISGDLSRGDHPSVTDSAGIDSAPPSTGQRYGLSPLC